MVQLRNICDCKTCSGGSSKANTYGGWQCTCHCHNIKEETRETMEVYKPRHVWFDKERQAYVDSDGNSYRVREVGHKEALSRLLSNTDCRYCSNCSHCHGCIGGVFCYKCTNCRDCTLCSHCEDCHLMTRQVKETGLDLLDNMTLTVSLSLDTI